MNLADMMIDSARKQTLLHTLLSVSEYIRDDGLNLHFLHIILEKCCSRDLLDLENHQGQTAMTVAVTAGNYHGVDQLLRAGADLEAGRNGNAILRALDRLLVPRSFSGPFKGISERQKESRRYEYNSIKIVMILLKREADMSKLSDEHARGIILQRLPRWRSEQFINASILASLPEDDRESTIKIFKTQAPCVVKGDGSTRQLEMAEVEASRFCYKHYNVTIMRY
jgi:hypothetical protein